MILQHDYARLAEFLNGVSFRLRLLHALEFLLLLGSAFILVLLGGLFAPELGKIYPALPFIYALAAILALGAFVLLGGRRVVGKRSMEQTARGLEEKFPHLGDHVTNSLQLVREVEGAKSSKISAALVAAQVRRTAREVCALEVKQVVSFRQALRHLRILLPLLAAFIGVLCFDPYFLDRSLAMISHPFAALPAKETSISLEPLKPAVLRGTPVVIRAKAKGQIPDKLMLTVWPEGKEEMRFPMRPEGEGKFSYQIASAQFSFRYRAQDGRTASPVYSLRVVDPPEVGKVKLTLVPPEYTGLPKEVKEEGHIQALKGTVANLEIQATRGVKDAKLILHQGKSEHLLEIHGGRLQGSLLVFDPGTYSITVRDELGFANINPVHYQIRLIPDQFPEGEILSPGRDLEISGNELLPVVYTARDDFGLTSVRLSYEMGGRERSIKLKSPNSGRSLGPESYAWDLAGLALAAGDRVSYRLEVADNDSISGPKVSYSRTFHLSVRDERERAAREGDETQQIAEALLELLGDHLEGARDTPRLAQGMEEILKKLERHLQERGSHKMDRFDLEALRRNLSSLKERIFAESKETVTREMERLALLAEDAAKRARMSEVEALAREIRNRQRRLIESLKDLKAPLSPKELEAVMKELKSLENLIRSVMEALANLAGRLPEEFTNSQDLQGLDFQDLFQELNEIQKKLQAGDVSGALEAAQKLLQALSQMMAALGRAGAQAGMAPFNRLQGEMSRQAGELDQILAEQKEILKETEKIDRETKWRAEEEAAKRLKQALPEFLKALEELRRLLPPEEKESAEKLLKSLTEERLGAFSRLAEELEKELGGKPAAKSEDEKLLGRLREMIKALAPDPKEAMSPEDQEKFPGLSEREAKLKDRTGSLQEKLEMMAQLFPGMDTEILKDLQGAAGAMGEASGRLTGKDAPGAIPPEQEVIRRLTKSQQGMQQMSQQMAMRMQAQRGRQLVYDPRPGWYYGPWSPMPTLPQPELNRPRERGYTGIDREEFEPPSPDAYQVPQLYREKIMEGMKEEAPSSYKQEVESYFRGLAE